MKKSIEQKYRKLTDIEHVLLRPGMYVGSIKSRDDEVYLLKDGKFEKRKILYNPAFLKIFDEILSNAVDEHRRNPRLNTIKVDVNNTDGWIRVWDNGGIPVVKHAVHDEWVPELIFSNLKAGSNFDDEEDRLVAGTNGVGSTLTNIFSTQFQVKTCDGKSEFEQTFKSNMTERDEARVSKTKKSGYTEVTYWPDLQQFEMTCIDESHIDMIKKRCLEMAACNSLLKIIFNGVDFKFTTFKDYCSLYSDNIVYEETDRWKLGIAASEGSFTQISFVNSVETRDGGTHVEYIIQQLVSWIREKIRKKHKIDLKPSEIRSHFSLFVLSDIVNPAFSSQTKEKLITEPKDFGSRFEISETVLKAVYASEVVERILDWAQQKALADERKQLRDLNKNIGKEKVLKLIDAKSRTDRESCTLGLFEGDSASSSVRKYRNPELQGAFPLRGKVLNVADLPAAKIIQNQEIRCLLQAIGLKMGEEPKDLRYGKILIYADADPDGDSIAGLLINFFGRYWPELFEKEKIFRVMTPLVVVERGSEKISFYTADEYEEWSKDRKDLNKWDVAYKKGLAALSPGDYKDIIQNPRMFALTPGKDLRASLDCWFGDDVKPRKNKILQITLTALEEVDDQQDS